MGAWASSYVQLVDLSLDAQDGRRMLQLFGANIRLCPVKSTYKFEKWTALQQSWGASSLG